jgi:hypothetical protein
MRKEEVRERILNSPCKTNMGRSYPTRLPAAWSR